MNHHHHTGDTDPPPDPPEEAYMRSEPTVLSPASPKPLHFPQPTNIPVLDKMMDVGFNQTEPHMTASTRDTELRSGAWREPNHSEANYTPAPARHLSDSAASVEHAAAAVAASSSSSHSNDAKTNGHDARNPRFSNGPSYEANARVHDASAPDVRESQHASSNMNTHAAANDATQHFNPLHASSDHSHVQPSSAPSAVDVQALLDTLQTSLAPAASSTYVNDGVNHSQAQSQASAQGLPPRPPPQEQPLINANYVHSQHIRDYHPHAAKPALHNNAAPNGTTTAADPSHVPPVASTPSTSAAAHTHPVQPPPSQSSNHPMESRREVLIANHETPTTDDQPWTSDTQRKYDHFMNEERRYVNEARWDQFPQGSRLFVGNLSSEKVTKRDIFHVFHHYGDVAQISIKQAYGFVQYLRTEDCQRALAAEQGRQIRDKRIHLEVSKPQKPPRNQQQQQPQGRRSRSPPYENRGRPGTERHSNGRRGREDREYRPPHRSPSPREYRNHYGERYRTRSRSPPDHGRERYRAHSPQNSPDDDLPLPRRSARDVPEVQIITLDPLARDFISWVENAFRTRGVRIDSVQISPRVSEEAVVKRQVVEGVLAICKLRRSNQDTGKIGLTIFKRRVGVREVQFEDYDNLDPPICAELALRERQLTSPAAPPSYSGGYSAPPSQPYGYQQPPAPYSAPTQSYAPQYGQPPMSYPVSTQALDPNNLQNLLSTLNTSTPQQSVSNPYGPPAQMAYSGHAGSHYPSQQAASAPPYSQPAPPASAVPSHGHPNMQDILARLGSYGRQ